MVRQSKSVSSREEGNALQLLIKSLHSSATLPPWIYATLPPVIFAAGPSTTTQRSTTSSTAAPPASTQERNIRLIQFSTPDSGLKLGNNVGLDHPNDELNYESILLALNQTDEDIDNHKVTIKAHDVLEEDEEQARDSNEIAPSLDREAQPSITDSREPHDVDIMGEGDDLDIVDNEILQELVQFSTPGAGGGPEVSGQNIVNGSLNAVYDVTETTPDLGQPDLTEEEEEADIAEGAEEKGRRICDELSRGPLKLRSPWLSLCVDSATPASTTAGISQPSDAGDVVDELTLSYDASLENGDDRGDVEEL